MVQGLLKNPHAVIVAALTVLLLEAVAVIRIPVATFRRKKEKLRGGWVQSANFASQCARKLLIL